MAATVWWGVAPAWLTAVLAAGLLAASAFRPTRLAALLIPAALVLGLARAGHHQQAQAPLVNVERCGSVGQPVPGRTLPEPPAWWSSSLQEERPRQAPV